MHLIKHYFNIDETVLPGLSVEYSKVKAANSQAFDWKGDKFQGTHLVSCTYKCISTLTAANLQALKWSGERGSNQSEMANARKRQKVSHSVA